MTGLLRVVVAALMYSPLLLQSAKADCSAALMAAGRLPLTADISERDWQPIPCDESQWIDLAYTRNRLQTVEPVSSFQEIEGLWVLDNTFPVANGLFTANHILRVLEIKAGLDPKEGHITYKIYQGEVIPPHEPEDPRTDLDIVLGAGGVRLGKPGEFLPTSFRLSSEQMESNRYGNSRPDSYRATLSPSEWRQKQSEFYGRFSGHVSLQKGKDAILFSARLADGRIQYTSAVKKSKAAIMATVYTDRAIQDGISRSFLRRYCYLNVFSNRRDELATALAPMSIDDVVANLKAVFHHRTSRDMALKQQNKAAYTSHQAAFLKHSQSAEILRMKALVADSPLFRCPHVGLE